MPQSFLLLGLPHNLWGVQFCPQPPFRRLLAAANDSRTAPKPAESRLQPGLAAPQLLQTLSFAKNFVALGFSLFLREHGGAGDRAYRVSGVNFHIVEFHPSASPMMLPSGVQAKCQKSPV